MNKKGRLAIPILLLAIESGGRATDSKSIATRKQACLKETIQKRSQSVEAYLGLKWEKDLVHSLKCNGGRHFVTSLLAACTCKAHHDPRSSEKGSSTAHGLKTKVGRGPEDFKSQGQ